MKRIAFILGVVFLAAVTAMAQGPVGLMVGDTFELREPRAMMAGAGINVGEDTTFFGARFTMSLTERVCAFGDIGIIDIDDLDDDPGIQIGAVYTFTDGEQAFDLGVRGAYATVFFDDFDYSSLSGMLVGSMSLDAQVEGLSVYGGVGLLFWESDVDGRIVVRGEVVSATIDDDDTETVLAVGIVHDLSSRLSVYAEYNHVDDSFFGGGVRCSL